MSAIQDKDIRNIVKKYINDSYLPTIILNASESRLVESYLNKEGLENDLQFKKLTAEIQSWVMTSVTTGLFYNRTTQKPSAILDRVWQFVSYILFPGRRLKHLKSDALVYIETAEREYAEYETGHEELLEQVQLEIDIINRHKTLMKEYILKRVAEKLSHMGIESEVADYQNEHLDTRKFGLNEEFKKIRAAFKNLQENTYSGLMESLSNGPFGGGPIVTILAHIRVRQLKGQIEGIKAMTRLVFEKMRSDNQKIENLYKAIKNIAEIFTDISNRFIPTVEKILEMINIKYHDNLSEIPSDVLCLLRSATKILKDISEKCILPKGDRDELINCTITTSNNMSVEHEKLRKTMSDAV